ncbi:hypothetical protein [Polaribacter dokdonensis]|uniref:Uncharacterized protein n=1 Tax=Polaribacter dokdonensis DSW-5 TaxID=1300348 RepID=A0A0N0CFF4_9FLAO|nr:hypothetical protein [Polaribacter dokdonensis]KOY51807.1 hypothetical protein I602_1367 [Polaribacter dokdonensis DSW-5]SEE02507.1 hypothetical protein SAMN05444353_0403 [Polaribacter dokdonensis DSW-5]
MNKTIKTVLLIVGVILLAYGIYTMVIPETKVAIGDVSLVEAQDNTNSFIIIGLGIVAVVLSLVKGKS